MADELTAEYIIGRWPRLFHMAEVGSWPSIERHGLRSTTALLDLFEIDGQGRIPIEAMRRPEAVAIHHPEFGTAWIRDNKPINETVLRRTLRGMTEPEWYRTLNGRVFFWLTEKRLNGLRNAAANKGRDHTILVLDTERVLKRYGEQVELSPINSGAVHGGCKTPRGVGTFSKIRDYPWAERRKINSAEPIVELTVPYRVGNVAALLDEVREV